MRLLLNRQSFQGFLNFADYYYDTIVYSENNPDNKILAQLARRTRSLEINCDEATLDFDGTRLKRIKISGNIHKLPQLNKDVHISGMNFYCAIPECQSFEGFLVNESDEPLDATGIRDLIIRAAIGQIKIAPETINTYQLCQYSDNFELDPYRLRSITGEGFICILPLPVNATLESADVRYDLMPPVQQAMMSAEIVYADRLKFGAIESKEANEVMYSCHELHIGRLGTLTEYEMQSLSSVDRLYIDHITTANLQAILEQGFAFEVLNINMLAGAIPPLGDTKILRSNVYQRELDCRTVEPIMTALLPECLVPLICDYL